MRVDVNEVFGPTVQGEGPLIGRRACFVRLARCDLQCSYCDTAFTWDWKGANGIVYDPASEVHPSTTEAVQAEVDRLDPDLGAGVVITGGEPLLQRRAVTDLATRFLGAGRWVQIETNGRHKPPLGLPQEALIVASPKLSNSGMTEQQRIANARVRHWAKRVEFWSGCPEEKRIMKYVVYNYTLALLEREYIKTEGGEG
jgi:organic radical activating enzyme